MTYTPTITERSVRATQVLHERANTAEVVELAIAGARAILAQEDPNPVTQELAEQLLELPPEPRFDHRDAVRPTGMPGYPAGMIVDRYIAERGGWEYQVRFPSRDGGSATHPYPEGDIEAAH